MEAEAFDIGKSQMLGNGGDGKRGGAEHDLGAADFEIENFLQRAQTKVAHSDGRYLLLGLKLEQGFVTGQSLGFSW